MDSDFFISILEKFGIQAVMLFWFMFRIETLIKKNNEIIGINNATIQNCPKAKIQPIAS